VKRWAWIAGGIAILAVIVFASIKGSGSRGENVYVEQVGRRDIEAVVSAPGEVDPKVKVNISAHVIGKIERLYIQEGQNVRRGDRLVDLEKENFTAQRDRMSSEVANRRIEVSRARINLADAERQYARARSLLDQGIQAQELHDRARLGWQNARSALASAEEAVRQATAGLNQAQTDLARTTIVAPMNGKIVSLNAHEGEVVITGTMNNPGSVIAVLADLSEILVQAEVGETEITRVRLGQTARIKIDAIPDKEYSGRAVEIGSSAETRMTAGSGQRYFNVKIALTNADDALRPGMTAQVEIITDQQKGVIAVPVQSVVMRGPPKKDQPASQASEEKKTSHVFLLSEEKVAIRSVKTGISDDTHVAILSGLSGNERVITGPFRTLRELEDGDPAQESKEEKKKSEPKKEEDDQEDER
jgi:HlyD family secretion protein